jgi:hypothetical protein
MSSPAEGSECPLPPVCQEVRLWTARAESGGGGKKQSVIFGGTGV